MTPTTKTTKKPAVKKAPVKKAPAKKPAAKPVAKPAHRGGGKAGKYIEGVGRRKTATARVRLYDGGKDFVINGRAYTEYFTVLTDQQKVMAPLEKTATDKQFGVTVVVKGGGVHAQAEAIRHGLARALAKFDEKDHRPLMRQLGFLTRDPRMRERKKFGLRRARRAPQFSKR